MPKSNYKPIALCDTSNMSEGDWLIMRSGYIGGSDIAAIYDLSPWKTSKELYDQKLGIKPLIKKEFNARNKNAGHRFESFVILQFIDWFQERYHILLKLCETIDEFNESPNAIFQDKHFYQCGEKDENGNLLYPFAAGNVDAIMKVNGKIGVIECKTFNAESSYGKKTKKVWQSGIVPVYYDFQGRYYMKILNVDYCFYVAAWGLLLEQMTAIKVERDYVVEDAMMKDCSSFYKAIESKSGWESEKSNHKLLTDYYFRLYGEVEKNKVVHLDPCWYTLMERFYKRQEGREQLNKSLENMAKEDDELLSLLYPVIENAGFVVCKKGTDCITVSIETPMTRGRCTNIADNALSVSARINWEGIKEDRPDIWEKCQTTTFDPSKMRTFYPKEYKEFKLPNIPTGERSRFEARKLTS